ncbi:DUF1206 domain-containing protein [Phytomonospora endophytica]|uniref:DUF1206 domain-containing protein n=1 Tax=Phytomonospora endophytica TaxID=714109 RepID=A0A841FVC0_9ACTN|nr:DUF1206 domain-containing protein [Phytomonospora endophytica]MBB6038713.1 hypothetical protein [Phytomonospora endophytica]GIG68490.1 membrane protein [Phytomonospora endophytica]
MTAGTSDAASKVARHPALTRLAKVGFASRGVLYLLMGVLALGIAFGSTSQKADKSGALHVVAATPFGAVLLWVMAIGLTALTIWQLADAIAGGRGVKDRVESVVRAVVYALIVVSILGLLLAGKDAASTDAQSEDATAAILDLPAGQLLVLLAAAGLAVLGVVWLVDGWREKFMEDMYVSSPRMRRPVTVLGKGGYIARGIIAIIAAVFVGKAALDYDPDEAVGIDGALRALTDAPAGRWLLAAVALGLILFAGYCAAEARWHRT